MTQLMRVEGDKLVAIASPEITPLRVPLPAMPIHHARHDDLVLVDLEAGRAAFVRSIAPPHATDLARLQAELAAFARAGYEDLIDDPASALATALERLAKPEGRPVTHADIRWDPHAFVLGRFLFHAAERDELYPLTFWEDVPAIGLEELEALMEAHLVRPRFQRRLLLAEARRILDNAPEPVAARRTLVARWCEAANDRLAEISTYRLCGPFELHDEPTWLLARPAQYEVLVREQLLEPRTTSRDN